RPSARWTNVAAESPHVARKRGNQESAMRRGKRVLFVSSELEELHELCAEFSCLRILSTSRWMVSRYSSVFVHDDAGKPAELRRVNAFSACCRARSFCPSFK